MLHGNIKIIPLGRTLLLSVKARHIYGLCRIAASTLTVTAIWRFLARFCLSFGFSELEGKAENEMFKSSPNLSATADSR